jgi:hypothetical protein
MTASISLEVMRSCFASARYDGVSATVCTSVQYGVAVHASRASRLYRAGCREVTTV